MSLEDKVTEQKKPLSIAQTGRVVFEAGLSEDVFLEETRGRGEMIHAEVKGATVLVQYQLHCSSHSYLLTEEELALEASHDR